METSEKDCKMNGQPNHLNPADEENSISKRKKGGFITMPFIIANESFEKVASYGLMPNMIVYLMKDYRMSVAEGTNLIFFWSAATNFLPLVGAFIADSFLGRFLTIGFGSIISLSGMILLWLTTVVTSVKPPPCDPLAPQNCQSPTAGQITLLVWAFLLMSIGAGGVRPCSQAFGADQVDQRDDPKKQKVLETFFNWYYACACFSVVIALTVIVYIQDHLGWRTGFGIPAILMFLSALSFWCASSFYVKNEVRKSLFSSLVRVAVAAYRNRRMTLPPPGSNVQYCYNQQDAVVTGPSQRLRFLNKACIITNPDLDLGPNGSVKDRWRLCTVEEVEELKALIRVLPIWSSGIMMSINTSQSSFALLQAASMDRHLGSKFQIPAGSYSTFLVIIIVLWIPLYDRVILPLASKIQGKPVRLSVKLRMGVGLFFTFTSMIIAGLVENIRRHKANASNGPAVTQMSAMWLVPQHGLNGLAEAFNAIGQTEFYYSEFPKSMSSIATSLSGLGMAVGSLLASVILNVVDDATKRGGKESWVSSNINTGHYDYYYWVLAILSFFNVLYYVLCSRCYGPLLEREKEHFVAEEELAMLRSASRPEKGDLGLS